MGKIVVGCWDCDYCGADRISGEIKICPNCGKPRGKDVTFYMAGPKNYVEDPDKINKNPDWVCPYCQTLNPDDNKFCSACGSAREESDTNYFESKEKDREREEKREEDRRKAEGTDLAARASGRSRLPLILILLAIFGLMVFAFMPKTRKMHVDSRTWERSVSIERYQEVRESSWNLQDGAWDVTSRDEVYTYNHVLDHYETRTREVSEQVLDGYDTEIEYRDLGNGYYEEIEHQVPRYRTEYHTETYQEPVYVDIPVFAKKYYYSIMKWLYDRDEVTSGADNEPYYAELNLPDNERESGRSEQYWILSGDKRYRVNYDLWKQIKTGSDIRATVGNGEIISIQ
jgi:hypothetical protein